MSVRYPAMATDHSRLLDELLPSVRKFVGSSGGGQWAFCLVCSVPRCRREDSISANARTIRLERERVAACEKLIRKGWRFRNGPICPDCRRSIAG
jgi:hypothetical protein